MFYILKSDSRLYHPHECNLLYIFFWLGTFANNPYLWFGTVQFGFVNQISTDVNIKF